uniref:Pancreatic triacylglycerol lipase 2 n=1 Tax=Colaphellus bowringi TaxID=561076 RepID=A0A8U0ARW8_9CUCU|nr:pancreatic triacylglycerol lipase 2 [Colaphellus bowringi]
MEVVVSTLCFLYQQTGPPSVNIQNGTYQLYPINRRICPEIDPLRDTIFELYTRSNPFDPQILLLDNETSISSSNINFSNPTVFFFHGFLESSRSDNAIQIRDKHLLRWDINIILVNNERLLAGPFYLIAAKNCLPIGKYVARFIDFLVSLGLQLDNLQIVGMSLGGQIAGLTGKHITSGKVARITGLDPAGPYFSSLSSNEKISKDDATFVDIVHTNAGVNGIAEKVGTLDIWVNGGTWQPACTFLRIIDRVPGSLAELAFCNHYQAYRMYVMSLIDPRIYEITECSSYKDYENGLCDSNNKTVMGYDIDMTLTGDFYIKTGVTAEYI